MGNTGLVCGVDTLVNKIQISNAIMQKKWRKEENA
jgi:hypothetical protein